MPNKFILWIFITALMFTNSHAEQARLSDQLENSMMKNLLGHWIITDSSLNANNQWEAGVGASWHFYTILNGHAIQDDWISPALTKPKPEGGRQFGTNIRIFNPKENHWEMAWASVKGQKVDTFTAIEVNNNMVMSGLFNGKTSRITFYHILPNSFAWKLEIKQSNASWLEVYRIQAKRVVKST